MANNKGSDLRDEHGELLSEWDRSEVMREFERTAVKNLRWLAEKLPKIAEEKNAKISDVTRDLTNLGPAASQALGPVKELGKTIKETFSADDPIVEKWDDEDAVKAYRDMVEKHGPPASVDDLSATWKDVGPYKELVIQVKKKEDDAKLESEAKDSLIGELKAMIKDAVDRGDVAKAYEIERSLDLLREE